VGGATGQRVDDAELIALALPRPGDPEVAAPPPSRTVAPSPVAQRVTATPQQLSVGSDVYKQNCAACHGARGEGVVGSNAPALRRVQALNDVRNMVSSGSAEMPAMSAVLTSEQIDAVSRYVIVELVGSP
jgi:mono/diheme cytochrome c family protein